MKKIGIVICNYNKKDYCLRCIQTVLDNAFKDYDIFVVDNASTDGSADAIRKQYDDQVTLLENQENLGGSGGFNTGIRKVCELEYEYLMCLDNDVQLDENAIGALYEFLKSHPDVGMAGSKIYHEGQPEYIQQFGLTIDFQRFCAHTLYCDQLDSPEVPNVIYCDTVAACSVMLPIHVVKKVGPMPEDNFIYWDDMEWGYLIKQAGYQVAAIGSSRALHEMGANVRKSNTFANYYLWRNSMNFFMKYTPEENWESMSFVLLRSVFDAVYECMYREEHNIGKTILFAMEDAMRGIRGQAEKSRILTNDGSIRRFIQLIRHHSSIYVDNGSEYPEMVSYIQEINPDIQILDQIPQKSCDPHTATLSFCNYIMEVTDFSLKKIYVDKELNILLNREDAEVVANYGYSLNLFLYMHQSLFLDAVKKLPRLPKCATEKIEG